MGYDKMVDGVVGYESLGSSVFTLTLGRVLQMSPV